MKAGKRNKKQLRTSSYRSFSFQNPCSQHYARFIRMESDGEGKHIPNPLFAPARQIQQTTVGTVNISLARDGNCAENITPVRGKLGHLLEHVPSLKPIAGAFM